MIKRGLVRRGPGSVPAYCINAPTGANIVININIRGERACVFALKCLPLLSFFNESRIFGVITNQNKYEENQAVDSHLFFRPDLQFTIVSRLAPPHPACRPLPPHLIASQKQRQPRSAGVVAVVMYGGGGYLVRGE